MESPYLESRRSCAVDVRRRLGQYCVNEPDRMAQVLTGNGKGNPSAKHHAKAARLAQVEETCMTASELERHLVRAITARTSGRIQALRVQILGGRTVLSGFCESYHAIQLAVAGLMETLDAMGLDQPERVDLNIDVLPCRAAQPQAASVLPGESKH